MEVEAGSDAGLKRLWNAYTDSPAVIPKNGTRARSYSSDSTPEKRSPGFTSSRFGPGSSPKRSLRVRHSRQC